MKNILILTFSTLILCSCGNDNDQNNKTFSEIDSEAILKNDSMIKGINEHGDSLINELDDLNQQLDSNTWFSDSLKKVSKIKEEKKVISLDKKIQDINKQNKEKTISKEDVEKTSAISKEIEKVIIPTQIVEENHKDFDVLLQKHVSSSGKVNYKGFKKEQDKLELYIKDMQLLYKDLKVWNKAKRLAYWINVYNANTINLILDNYPTTSITKLKGGKPWDFKIIELGNQNYTLNDIENKIIRPRFKEPRIHFAVNCAAKSCPKLLNKAWTEHNLYRYLTKQTKAFLANTTENTIAEDKVVLSKIFDWYKADFGGDNAKLITFINKYSSTKVNENASVEFKEYVWDLND